MSCGGGKQTKRRRCRKEGKPRCEGRPRSRRQCNLFACRGACGGGGGGLRGVGGGRGGGGGDGGVAGGGGCVCGV